MRSRKLRIMMSRPALLVKVYGICMKLKLQYLWMEVKKALRMFPRMVSQAILLMALIGTIAFCGVKRMERDPLAASVEIGVVVREDNRMTRMALSYVENMESVSKLCRFRQVTEEEGFALLEKGEAAALILLPEQLVEGIMNGVNPSVDIWFPKYAGLEAMLFRELTESGAGLLRVAQAQIYGAEDAARLYGLTEQLSGIEAQIDSDNLAFALDRLALYDDRTVSAFGTMNRIEFYLASGLVLFLLLAGMAMYPIVQREPEPFRRQLSRQGAGHVWQWWCRWLCGFLYLIALAGILYGAAAAVRRLLPILGQQLTVGGYPAAGGLMVSAGGAEAIHRLGYALLIVTAVNTLICLLHSLAGSRTGGILLIFLFSLGMVWLSGGLVPSLFLPETVQTIGAWLPTAYLIRAAGGLLTGQGGMVTGECVAALCGYTAVFGAAAMLCSRRE